MLNGDVDIISLETLCNLSTTVKNSIFIRPIGDLKTFTGQILQSHDIYSFVDGLIKRGITYDTLVSLSGVDNRFEIIEFNCLNASGFYDHNIIKFANCVTDYAKKSVDVLTHT